MIKTVSDAEQLHHEAEAIAKIKAREDRKTTAFRSMAAMCVLSVPFALSGWVVWAVKPRIETRVDYVPVAEDGTPVRSFNFTDMPVEARKRDIMNSVIRYVEKREEFNELQSGRNWDIVSRMSIQEVQEKYQQMNDGRSETSQWKRYAPGGWVKFSYDSIIDEKGVSGYADIPPGYTVRFCRQEKIKDRPPTRPQMYQAVVGFKVVPGYDPRLLATDNPGSIQVTYYREAEPVGAISNQPANGLKGCLDR